MELSTKLQLMPIPERFCTFDRMDPIYFPRRSFDLSIYNRTLDRWPTSDIDAALPLSSLFPPYSRMPAPVLSVRIQEYFSNTITFKI